MNDLLRIDDVAVRDAIDICRTHIEIAIGNLLDHDRSTALAQIKNARNRAELSTDVAGPRVFDA
jgi:hypothetical protein